MGLVCVSVVGVATAVVWRHGWVGKTGRACTNPAMRQRGAIRLVVPGCAAPAPLTAATPLLYVGAVAFSQLWWVLAWREAGAW